MIQSWGQDETHPPLSGEPGIVAPGKALAFYRRLFGVSSGGLRLAARRAGSVTTHLPTDDIRWGRSPRVCEVVLASSGRRGRDDARGRLVHAPSRLTRIADRDAGATFRDGRPAPFRHPARSRRIHPRDIVVCQHGSCDCAQDDPIGAVMTAIGAAMTRLARRCRSWSVDDAVAAVPTPLARC